MTVEQTALPQYNQKPIKEDYAKIAEVTGIQDVQQINTAIEACQKDNGTYEITDVISMLTGQHEGIDQALSPKPQPVLSRKLTEAEPTPFIGPRNRPEGSSKTKADVVDLTAENNGDQDEIQRAIAESLKDTTGILGGQVSREEQEISRLLEQSLEESKASSKRKRGGDIWFVDPLNPHERKRLEGWPVGLKNVGNTCWFSAVIQSLFLLPIFRRLVLKFTSPESLPDGSLEARNLRFMRELRNIFALMVGTKRKYIDPSRAVEILKEAFSGSGSSDSQQDVSEFQHKLLEWLEDAFRRNQQYSGSHGASSSQCGEQSTTNPMIQLFYGQYRVEGTNEGKSFTNEETFGQFPLQVEGVQDIHASLEAAMAQGEIENATSHHKSRQEQWFTTLPPVLTFELSRFQFNQALGRPEKIHNRLEFPELLFMDRYMENNKLVTRQKREEVKKLREELQLLHEKLDKFVHYGSGPKRVPLQDVLKYALEFAQTQRPGSGGGVFLGTPPRSPLSPTTPQPSTSSHPPPGDIDMESPKSHCSMVVDSPGSSITHSRPADPPDLLPTSTPPRAPLMTSGTDLKPSPRQVAPTELQVLQSCLKRWRTEVENDVRELQEQISRREEAVAQMYNDSNLHMYPYRLHAVLVHEGQAASGHYWAYVYCMHHRKWLKFNDITVSEATWEELQKDSMGGYHNASAYCLMYLHATRTDVLTGDSVDGETGVSYDKGVTGLPLDLQKLVEEDNNKFSVEIEQWDREQTLRVAKTSRTLGVGGGDASEHPSSGEHQLSAGTQTVSPSTALLAKHALLASTSTQSMLKMAAAIPDTEPAKALQQAMTSELNRLNEGLRDLEMGLPHSDPRLSDILVYLVANEASRDTVIMRTLLEKLTFLPTLDSNPKYKEMRSLAVKELDGMVQHWTHADKLQYQQWHKEYEKLRKCAYVFCLAMKAFTQERYTEALPYFVCACDLNNTLIKSYEGSQAWSRGLHNHLLTYFRRQCILQVNEYASTQFEEDIDVDEALTLMNQLVLPALSLLSQNDHLDQTALEEVRDKWCHFLSLQLSDDKVEKLQDLLSGLFELPSDPKPMYSIDSIRFVDDPNLSSDYESLVKAAKMT